MAVLTVIATVALVWHLLGPLLAHSGEQDHAASVPAAAHHGESEQCDDVQRCDHHDDTCGYLVKQDNGHYAAPVLAVIRHVSVPPDGPPTLPNTGGQRSRDPPDPVRELQVIRV